MMTSASKFLRILMIGCAGPAAFAEAAAAQTPSFSAEYIAENRGTEKFLIPETYELANIIISLTPYGRENQNRIYQRTEYYRAVQDHFSGFADHPVIRALDLRSDEDIRRFFSFREDSYAYRFEDDRLVKSGPYSALFDPRAENAFGKHVDLVADFARKSGFRGFYAAQRPYYERLTAEFSRVAPLSSMIEWLEAKFGSGYRFDSYKVVFSPLTAFSHSAQQGVGNGFRESLMFVGAPHIFGNAAFAEPKIARMIFTEVDHNFVNPTSDRFRAQLDEAMSKLCFWNNPSSSGGYGTQYSTFNEYMTWALFTLWARDRCYDHNRENFYDLRKINRFDMWDRGFPRFVEFDRALERLYLSGGEKARIPDLYPALLAEMRTLQTENAARVTCGETTR